MEKLRLNKKGWHLNLMRWIWGFRYYDFEWGCPYVWLTLFNLIIFLPFSLFKVTFIGFAKFNNFLFDYFERRFEHMVDLKYGYTAMRWDLDPGEWDGVVQKLQKMRWDKARRILDVLMEKSYLPFWIYQKAKETITDNLYFSNSLRDIKRERVRETNKERIASIMKYAKPIALFFLGIATVFIAGFVVFWIVRFIYFMLHLPKHNWIDIGNAVLIVLGILLFILLTAYGIEKLKERRSMRPRRVRSNSIFWYRVGTPFRFIGRGIVLVVRIIVNSCPKIEWTE